MVWIFHNYNLAFELSKINKDVTIFNDIGHINKLEFDGDYRTKTHLNAAEPVQELLNKFFSNR